MKMKQITVKNPGIELTQEEREILNKAVKIFGNMEEILQDADCDYISNGEFEVLSLESLEDFGCNLIYLLEAEKLTLEEW